ncbi:MAG: HAMP domain-containing histidine kinase [Clostridia bacterium]|nr:HAMP domain-containing histidine kinase [Clostridia bacterium]
MKKPRSRRKVYKNRRQSTSIFFMLWATFTVVTLSIVLLLGGTQVIALEETYKNETGRLLMERGARINRAVRERLPDPFGVNYDAYVRHLAQTNDVHVYILTGEGEVLFPLEDNSDSIYPAYGEEYDFTQKIVTLKEELSSAGATAENGEFAVYEEKSAKGFVYGAVLPGYGENEETYLYVFKSVVMMEAVVSELRVRTLMMAIFVFLVAFAASMALSGFFTRPINEMTEKARRLAGGDWEVDFHGTEYGSEMTELADTLNFARDEISKADKLQKELIANVSHDFKTPLTMIKAYASMIVEISGDVPEKRNKHAQVIIDETDRLASLVSDVLDLSKLQAGIQEIKRNLFDLSSYVEDVLQRFDYLKETGGYRFVVEVEEDLYTVADELKIGQVLYNLIGNAVNYTGEDKTVKILLKREDGRIRFAVTDTGKGIKPEERADIWNRYYRSSETHKRPVRGTGLGLSIVKTILEKHGFLFGVDSTVGVGSTFYVYFPLEEN